MAVFSEQSLSLQCFVGEEHLSLWTGKIPLQTDTGHCFAIASELTVQVYCQAI